jgi:gluconate 5-dehydrogenase
VRRWCTCSRPDGGVFSVAYNTSKGALITLTQALATEWGKHNINVNAICPGYFPTKLSGRVGGKGR